MVEPPRAGSLSLVGGSLALDFVNTSSGRENGPLFEHLRGAEDLIAWAAHSGALDSEGARRANVSMADSAIADRLLRQAVALREAIYRIGSSIARNEAPPTDDLSTVKDVAQKSMRAGNLALVERGGYGLDVTGAPAETAILGPIAWSAISLLATTDFARIKQCPGEDCGWLFVDLSKNNSRRWCDMATCGNRTKAERHRHRH